MKAMTSKRRVVYTVASVVLLVWSITLVRLWLAQHEHRHTTAAAHHGLAPQRQQQHHGHDHVAPGRADRERPLPSSLLSTMLGRAVGRSHDASATRPEAGTDAHSEAPPSSPSPPPSLPPPSSCEARGLARSMCAHSSPVTATSGRAITHGGPILFEVFMYARCMCVCALYVRAHPPNRSA